MVENSESAALRSARSRALAWCVHGFTAAGGALGFFTLYALFEGRLRAAAALSLAALVVDALDGALARRARVSEVLPGFDGRRLDDIIDYLNYVVAPAMFLVVAGSLSTPWLAALPVLASAFGFSRADAKTADHFFLGFPSYWNVLAIYLWLLEAPPTSGSLLLLTLTAAVFIPLRYVYPSRTPRLRNSTCALGALWVLVITLAVAAPSIAEPLRLAELSLLYPIYYLALSAWLGDWLGLRSRRA